MIPKILHQIWLGGDVYEKIGLRFSFMRKNMDWSFMLWTEKNIDLLKGISERVKRILNDQKILPIVKADCLRFELLYLFGGVYSDMDFICYKNLDKLLNCNSFCGLSWFGEFGDSFFGSVKGNEICREIAEASANKVLKDYRKCNKNPAISGVTLHGEYMKNFEVIHPVESFFPFSFKDTAARHLRYDSPENYPESYVAHLWDGMNEDGWVARRKM